MAGGGGWGGGWWGGELAAFTPARVKFRSPPRPLCPPPPPPPKGFPLLLKGPGERGMEAARFAAACICVQ